MASSDALWNEVARLINVEFVSSGESLTGKTLKEIILIVQKELTDDDPSA